MKFFLLIVFFAFFSPGLFAQDWSGIMDSTVNYTAGAGEAPDHSFGFEQFANLRLRVRTRDSVVFHAALNLAAMSGNYLESASSPLIYGPNYAAILELERLYFRITGEHIDTEAGLLRMNFGYGQVWASSDFLNPRNPMLQNARNRGVLGMNFSIYPADTLRFMAFATAPSNPQEIEGAGFTPGLVMDKHWERGSFQGLYAFKTPGFSELPEDFDPPYTSTKNGIHYFGFSLKFDLGPGFVLDSLYSLNPEELNGIDSLSSGIGFDYSFMGGSLYLLFEYLFNGSTSITAVNSGGNWVNNHFLYGSAMYRISDFTSFNLAAIFCMDDLSFQPIFRLSYEAFQGFTLSLSARLPLDKRNFGGAEAGELGPIPPYTEGTAHEGRGTKFYMDISARLRY